MSKYTVRNICERIEEWLDENNWEWGYTCPGLKDYHSLNEETACCKSIVNWMLKDKHLIKIANGIKAKKPDLLNHCRFLYYKRGRHDGKPTVSENGSSNTNQVEKNIAKALFRFSQRNSNISEYTSNGVNLGRIIDYETPTIPGGKRNIDLLSVSSDGRKLFFLELKKRKSIETLLRCILEAYSYFLLVDMERMLEDFCSGETINKEKVKEIVICPLIFDDSECVAYKDYSERSDLIKSITAELVRITEPLDGLKLRFDCAVLSTDKLSDAFDDNDKKWLEA